MPNREMTPANWAVKGELFLNCSCDVFCPCVVSLGAHLPTEGHCHAWMGIVIDEGHFEGEDLAGLNVGLLVDIPGRMGEGNWKVAAYVDDRASEAAYDGLLKIFSGAAGGTTGLFTMLARSSAPNVRRLRSFATATAVSLTSAGRSTARSNCSPGPNRVSR